MRHLATALTMFHPPRGIGRTCVPDLLQQRLGEVEFQIPFAPNDNVEQMVLDITVKDISEGPGLYLLNLGTDLGSEVVVNRTDAHFHLDLPRAHEHNLPNLISGWYQSNPIEIDGVLHTDGECFEHFFRPDSRCSARDKGNKK